MNEERRTFVRVLPIVGVAAAITGTFFETATAHGDQDDRPRSSPRKVVAGGSPNFSRTVEFDKVLYVSGVLGVDPETRKLRSTEFEGQCRQVLANLKASVEAGGSNLGQVLKCTCFLVAASDFEQFNKVYREYFSTDPPARSTVVVKELVMPGALIELECIAHT